MADRQKVVDSILAQHGSAKKAAEPKKYDKPISLAPLSLEEALRGAAATGPMTDDGAPSEPEAKSTGRKVTKTWRERKAASAKRAKREG